MKANVRFRYGLVAGLTMFWPAAVWPVMNWVEGVNVA